MRTERQRERQKKGSVVGDYSDSQFFCMLVAGLRAECSQARVTPRYYDLRPESVKLVMIEILEMPRKRCNAMSFLGNVSAVFG